MQRLFYPKNYRSIWHKYILISKSRTFLQKIHLWNIWITEKIDIDTDTEIFCSEIFLSDNFSWNSTPMHKVLPKMRISSIKHSDNSFQNPIKMFTLEVHEESVLIQVTDIS